jgi:pimeloyl-ACP methyl ester carboxylesterase
MKMENASSNQQQVTQSSQGNAPGNGKERKPLTFVLVHGAWHGGWCWKRTADRLRSAGHTVFTPTLTGLGERRHLLSKDITFETVIQDVAGVIESEDLTDVVLVGHSWGGIPVSGVADRMPGKIKQIIFLDSLLVQPGKTGLESLPAELAASRIKAAAETSDGVSLPVPPAITFGVSDPGDAEWIMSHLTPHPFGTFTSVLNIKGPIGNNLPCTYIGCVNPAYPAVSGTREWAKEQKGIRYIEMNTGHDAMIMSPDDLTSLLIELAA